MNKIEGQVVIVTGATSGIGKETAIQLADNGAKVILAARRTERLKEIKEIIEKSYGIVEFVQTDVTNQEQVQALAEFAVNKFGRIDVWINNAGVMQLSFIDKLKVSEWERMIDVNVKGVLYGIASAIPEMKKQKNGHIINISSVAGMRVGLTQSIYSGTKFAIRAITEGLRQELSPKLNIKTTLISPGSVNTELREHITDLDAVNLLQKREMEFRLTPENIASAIIYAIKQPKHVSVNEIVIRPIDQRT
ncbi:SDR family oxidoreductase [Ornithinibacillus halophilus]|uniref:NADP-dependent 3-hydroxy acid dehydrogenase YdfG n=1 Tax=Ornithinibacillus halophilus TaxID=930117 RepID=A0A1M5GL35_9BACI|nr:SDR family oxidoreductase [Ornithinibacillus halophilus]SHG04454.1 NADP-dependent 3-hydroxy acid dehydrogenase YdfG [Ornithinibacillus halophilus]